MHSGNSKATCTLCGGSRDEVFSETVLDKYRVKYYLCSNCGVLQTEEPYWLDEAYSSAVVEADTGLLQRNIRISFSLQNLLLLIFGREGKYLDTAGGYGVLTRLMRDCGFDYYWHDDYCENVHARGFESEGQKPPYSAITAFEVLEHVYDPVNYIRDSLDSADCRTFIFTTQTFSGEPPARDWWYYTFSTGQHISILQNKTLDYIAKELGLHLHSYKNWHMLTDKKVNRYLFRLSVSNWMLPLSFLLRLFSKSRVSEDHKMIMNKKA
ncbi:MAG: class I SAM-dependent methyltransferase [Candidatus Sedimenticola sp. PURPLELP]